MHPGQMPENDVLSYIISYLLKVQFTIFLSVSFS
jgi:hypothetical protein